MAGARGFSAWHVERWPEADQAAWQRGCTPGDPFDDAPSHALRLRPASLAKARQGYGAWLCFLAARGWLEPDTPGVSRVTPGRLRAYFRGLRAAGYADYTVIGRFAELAMALRILAPGEDVAWARRPFGATVYASLHKRRRMLIVPDAKVLSDWAIGLMDRAADQPGPASLLACRDGLLLALFAARARRLRSMALLRVGYELRESDEGYRVELTPDQVKTNKPDHFAIPGFLVPYLRHYLAVVRPALLRGHRHAALWVAANGAPLTAKGIAAMVERRTREQFGTAFRPHRFRHAAGTTAALRDPANPGLAAGLLGISPEVLERHYNLAGQADAAHRYAELLARNRRAIPDR